MPAEDHRASERAGADDDAHDLAEGDDVKRGGAERGEANLCRAPLMNE